MVVLLQLAVHDALDMQCGKTGYAGLRGLVMLVCRVKAAHKPDEVVEIGRFTESGRSSRWRGYTEERFERSLVRSGMGESRQDVLQWSR